MQFFVLENTGYYSLYLFVFKAAKHLRIERDSSSFAYDIVLYHINEIARIGHVFCRIEIVSRGRILAINRLRAEREYGFAENCKIAFSSPVGEAYAGDSTASE